MAAIGMMAVANPARGRSTKPPGIVDNARAAALIRRPAPTAA